MQISSAGTDQASRAAGFTLIEILVVLVILGLAMAVVVPAVSKGIGQSLDDNARTVQLALRKARADAVLSQRSTAVLINTSGKSLRSEYDRNSTALSSRLSLRATGALSERTDSSTGIRFFPDGSSTGGRVMLSLEASSATVNVDWLTGRVSIQQGAN